MKTKNNIAAVLFAVLLTIPLQCGKGDNGEQPMTGISPVRGPIESTISATGTVQPKNRLEIKPSVGGRIDRVLVDEGAVVYTGQVLAWMSSTERAALIDTARMQGKDTLKYWEEAYKPIPVVAPIRGMVIVRSVEPGQTVTNTSVILVLSDRLIVAAQVDETDIGRVKVGQRARIGLDAYPEVRIKGKVAVISFESKIVNNVTTYTVEILPDTIPPVFRSGMSTTVTLIERRVENGLLIPAGAVQKDTDGSYVLVKGERGQSKRRVTVGLTSDDRTEILTGLRESDVVLTKNGASGLYRGERGQSTTPFLPRPPRAR